MNSAICSYPRLEGWATYSRPQVSCDDTELATSISPDAHCKEVNVGRRHEKIRVFVVAFLIPHGKSGLKRINLSPQKTV